MRRFLALTLILVELSACTASRGTGTVKAENEICEDGGKTTIQGAYLVMNNRWGNKTATQCISVSDTGFRISQFAGSNDPDNWNNPPVGYPNILLGCHFQSCSPDNSLPRQLNRIPTAYSSVSFNFVDNGVYDAAYDIWLDTGPDAPPGGPAVEIMIHLNDQGLSSLPVENVSVGGRDWGRYERPAWWPGGQVEAIFFAPSPVNSIGLNVMDFVNDLRGRHPEIGDEWYLKMISAGIECWSDCVGAGVNSFAASVR